MGELQDIAGPVTAKPRHHLLLRVHNRHDVGKGEDRLPAFYGALQPGVVLVPDMTMHGGCHGGLHEGKLELVGAGKILVLGEVETRFQVFADLSGYKGVEALYRGEQEGGV